jgi:hypothetical protein
MSFDQLVPEADVYGERDLREVVEVEPTKMHARPKRMRRVRGINSSEGGNRPKPKLRISSQSPKSLSVAAKRIEREWNPDKRRKHERSPVPRQRPRFEGTRAVDQPATMRPARKPVKRSWETI